MGFRVELDHDTLETVLNSGDTVNSLVRSIGGAIPGPAQPWFLLIAKFVAGARALLRAPRSGNGIYLSMSWFAPPVPTEPTRSQATNVKTFVACWAVLPRPQPLDAT